jgi:predicted DNA-binding transcriptional regulator YafY
MTRMQETTRIARVLDIIWRISTAPNYWTRKRLAQQFEVSERAITSDLQIIRHRLRFELTSERGKGYRFSQVPQLPSVSYSIPEALALILAAQVGRQFSGIPQHDLAGALARLTSVVPEELRRMVERFGSEQGREPDDRLEQWLTTCSQAISATRSLDIVYAAASADGVETTRRIDPYAVFPYERSWHIVSYCHLRDDVRIFKVDRIRSARMTDAQFKVREGFDLSAFLSAGWGLIRGVDTPVEDVALRFHPPAARWVIDDRWHSSQRTDWQPDGTLLMQLRIQVTPEFQRWVFRYGRDVEVIAPDGLRDWIVNEAEALIAAYRKPSVPEMQLTVTMT